MAKLTGKGQFDQRRDPEPRIQDLLARMARCRANHEYSQYEECLSALKARVSSLEKAS